MLSGTVLKRQRSGIDIIDGRLGGFVAGKAYLVYGEPGTGKTVFGLQFLNEGLTNGETCALVAQENPGDLLTMGRHIGFDWSDHLASGRLIILTYLPNFGPRFSKSFNLIEVFEELQYLFQTRKIDRLVFDPITPFVDCLNRMNYSKVFAEFFTLLEKLGSTTLLTLDEISGTQSSPFLRTLISLAFGAIHLRISPDLRRMMFFQKLKYQSELLQPTTYTIEPRKGIVGLTSKTRIGHEPDVPKRKILIGDEDRSMCESIKRMLGDKYTLTFVHDGIEALTKIVNNPLDLIILDTTLPKIDGFDICRRLRSQGSSIPVFLISAKMRRSSDRVSAFNLGADEYMLKPLNLLELRSRVEAILQRGKDLKHAAVPRSGGLREGVLSSEAPGSGEEKISACLCATAFRKRVAAEMEGSASNLFTLVGCQFKAADGQEEEELTRICTDVLVSEVREDDFVGNLGNGRVCVFLRGTGPESSDVFIGRARKRISKVMRETLESPGSAPRMRTESATFPMDGEDAATLLEKAFGNQSNKPQR